MNVKPIWKRACAGACVLALGASLSGCIPSVKFTVNNKPKATATQPAETTKSDGASTTTGSSDTNTTTGDGSTGTDNGGTGTAASPTHDPNYDGSALSGNNPQQSQLEIPEHVVIYNDHPEAEDMIRLATAFFACMEYASATGDLTYVKELATPEFNEHFGGYETILTMHKEGRYTDRRNHEFSKYRVADNQPANKPVLTMYVKSGAFKVYQDGQYLETVPAQEGYWGIGFEVQPDGQLLVNAVVKK